MKKSLLAFSVIFLLLGTNTFAEQQSKEMKPCPKYYCVAGATGFDYIHQNLGYGYNDDLLAAQSDAVTNCEKENDGGSCALSDCFKNTGPTFKFFKSCLSQW